MIPNKILHEVGMLIDQEALLSEVNLILRDYPFSDQQRQISLRNRSEKNQSILDGCGSLADYSTNEKSAQEADFSCFYHQYSGGYIFSLILQLENFVKKKMGRVRLMNLPPRRCYSIHKDTTPRYHIPIKTNPQAMFLFPDFGAVHLPAIGEIYYIDTRVTHSALNGGLENRIHLVICESEEISS